jgi:hypothetical protein
MPQAASAAPWHPDGHDADNWPPQNPPNWAQLQPPTENTFPASNGVRGMAGDQPLPSENGAPQPALTVQNLTTHVLRMKGVPDADIGAAINDPAKMQNLLNQVYGRRPVIGVRVRATWQCPRLTIRSGEAVRHRCRRARL